MFFGRIPLMRTELILRKKFMQRNKKKRTKINALSSLNFRPKKVNSKYNNRFRISRDILK